MAILILYCVLCYIFVPIAFHPLLKDHGEKQNLKASRRAYKWLSLLAPLSVPVIAAIIASVLLEVLIEDF